MSTTPTTFGTVERDASGTTVCATGSTLHLWATRGESRWPCSELARLDGIVVRFDANGDLVDLSGGTDNLTADELNAWTSECLIRAGYPNHPAIR